MSETANGGKYIHEAFRGWDRGAELSLEERVVRGLPSETLHEDRGRLQLGMANGDPVARQRKIGIGHASDYSEDVAVLAYSPVGLLGIVIDGRHHKIAADICSEVFADSFFDTLAYLRAEHGPDVSPHAAIHHTVLSLDHNLISSRLPKGRYFPRFEEVQEAAGIAAAMSSSATIGLFYIEENRAYTFDTGDCLTFWSNTQPTKLDRMSVLRSKDALRRMESRSGAVIGDPGRPLLDTAFYSAGHDVHAEARGETEHLLQPHYETFREKLIREHLQKQGDDAPELILEDPQHRLYKEAARAVQPAVVSEMQKTQESLKRTYFLDKYGPDAVDIPFSKLYPAMRYKTHEFGPGDRLVIATDGMLPARLNLPGPEDPEIKRERLYATLTLPDPQEAMSELLTYAVDGTDNLAVITFDF